MSPAPRLLLLALCALGPAAAAAALDAPVAAPLSGTALVPPGLSASAAVAATATAAPPLALSPAPAPLSPTAAGPGWLGQAWLWLSDASTVSPTAAGLSGTAKGLSGTAKGLSGTAKALTRTASLRDGFREDEPIDIQGGKLRYSQGDETLLADGDVVLDSGGVQLHADKLWYDMKKGTLRAEGQVVVAQDGNTLWAHKVAMDQVSRTGTVDDLLFYQKPWSAACGSAELLPGDVVLLKGCQCTSCSEAQPMWRLSADVLKVKTNDRIWAWGVWLYTGRVPVFYLPYFSQSMQDPRPPIEIKPGYTQELGAYVRTAYNFYLGDGQFGTVRYDWMDKVGNGLGAGDRYHIPGGSGSIAGYMAVSKTGGGTNGWSGNWNHHQDFGGGLSLNGNVDLLSSAAFNETYGMGQVDSFQQRSYLSLASTQKTYSWTIQADETDVLQSIPDGNGGILSQSTVPVERVLPSLSFTRYSEPVRPGSTLYWGMDARLDHRFVPVMVALSPTGQMFYSVTAAANLANYMAEAIIDPNMTYTLKVNRRLSLNTNINISSGFQRPDMGWSGPSYGQSSYGTWVDGQYKASTAVTLDLGHRYLRQLSGAQSLPWAGEETDQVEAKVQDQLNASTSLLLNTFWDIRPYDPDNELKRLDLLHVQTNWNPAKSSQSGSLSGGWNAYTQQWKTVDAWFNLNDLKRRWQNNLGFNWVNNSIVMQPTSDPAAPQPLVWQSPQQAADQLLLSLRGTYELGPQWKMSYYEQLDLSARRLNEQALDIWRDFGCINAEVYVRDSLYSGMQYGFSLNLASVPGVSINSNQITNDLFKQVQYGY